jgi:hypothetical protein
MLGAIMNMQAPLQRSAQYFLSPGINKQMKSCVLQWFYCCCLFHTQDIMCVKLKSSKYIFTVY